MVPGRSGENPCIQWHESTYRQKFETDSWMVGGSIHISSRRRTMHVKIYTLLQYTGESRPPISFLLVTLIAKIGESTFRYDVDRIGLQLIAIAILLSKYNGNPQLWSMTLGDSFIGIAGGELRTGSMVRSRSRIWIQPRVKWNRRFRVYGLTSRK